MLLDWSAIATAVEDGLALSRSLDECLQRVVPQNPSDAGDDAMRDPMLCIPGSLICSFEDFAVQHIKEIVESCQADDVEKRSTRIQAGVHPSRLWPETKKLLRLALVISRLPCSTQNGLELFHQIFQHTIPPLWIDDSVAKHDILFVFDEVLLRMCWRMRTEHVIGAMRFWRERLTEQPLVIKQRYSSTQWGCRAFLVRAMQSMTEVCMQDTVQLVVGKVTNGLIRLPPELANMIADQVLTDYDIPKLKDSSEFWATASAPSRDLRCCIQNTSKNIDEHRIYWSTSERRYVLFHRTTPGELAHPSRSNGRSAREQFSLHPTYPLGSYTRVFVRCLKQVEGRQDVNHSLMLYGPIPAEGNDAHSRCFEMDHNVGRNWRIKLIEAAE